MTKLIRLLNYCIFLIGLGLIGYGRVKVKETYSEISEPNLVSHTNCSHLPYGMPKGLPVTNNFICRELYAISSNDETKMADVVAYCVGKDMLKGDTNQQRQWQADPAIAPPETLERSDYKGVGRLGFDRGHQAPLAHFRGGNWATTNYLSNITPQKAELNRGAWKDLESYERNLIREYGNICVLTGPYYLENNPMPTLPNADEAHIIPNGYWKVISYNNGEREVYKFEQNTAKDADFRSGKTSLEQVEMLSGLKLFPLWKLGG